MMPAGEVASVVHCNVIDSSLMRDYIGWRIMLDRFVDANIPLSALFKTVEDIASR